MENNISENVLNSLPKWEDTKAGLFKNKEFALSSFDYEVKEFNKTGDIYYLLKVVNDIIKYSDISITEITNNTGLSRPTIYNIINKNNIPKLDTISLLLKELGYRICIEPISRLV